MRSSEVMAEELPFAGWSRASMLAMWMGYCAFTILGVHCTWWVFGRDPLSLVIIHGDLVRWPLWMILFAADLLMGCGVRDDCRSIDVWSFIHTLVFFGIGWCAWTPCAA